MGEKHYIAVPTAYNIYRVSDEVLQSTQGLMATMPTAIVMETLVLRGLAKVVARIKPYDMQQEKDDGSDFYATQEYEPGVIEPTEEDTPEEKLPGPWWVSDGEDGKEEDGA